MPGTPGYKDEVVSFLGASYFRALGQGQRYGASARGLAIDTAERSGEEFPALRAILDRTAEPQARRQLVIYALLDSRRVTGAYRFVIRPGEETATDVQARLYLREPVAKLAIAPLTSMFFFGENQRAPTEDFRPEVHDSDGLAIHAANGEWIWRPLVNPRRLLVTSFALTDPRGFGLMQRDRQFDQLRRPGSALRIAAQRLGRACLKVGRRPRRTGADSDAERGERQHRRLLGAKCGAAAGHAVLILSYRMLWLKDTDRRPPNGWVVQTRRGHGYQRNTASNDTLKLTVDFDGPALRKLPVNAPVQADVAIGNGQSTDLVVHRNDVTGGWRMVVELRTAGQGKTHRSARISAQRQGSLE